MSDFKFIVLHLPTLTYLHEFKYPSYKDTARTEKELILAIFPNKAVAGSAKSFYILRRGCGKKWVKMFNRLCLPRDVIDLSLAHWGGIEDQIIRNSIYETTFNDFLLIPIFEIN